VLQLPIPSNVKVWRENKEWSSPYQMVALNSDNQSVIVEINNKQVAFRITAVRSYYEDYATSASIPAEDKDYSDDSNNDFTPIIEEEPVPVAKRKRGRPPGSKNKPKVVTATVYLN
jgi:hypothetical protein